jgi:predicted anti-sigma-YlaC factor YlaD
MLELTWVRWVLAAIVAAAVVALLAWARNDAGIDDRVPDPEDATAAIVLVDGVRAAV